MGCFSGFPRLCVRLAATWAHRAPRDRLWHVQLRKRAQLRRTFHTHATPPWAPLYLASNLPFQLLVLPPGIYRIADDRVKFSTAVFVEPLGASFVCCIWVYVAAIRG